MSWDYTIARGVAAEAGAENVSDYTVQAWDAYYRARYAGDWPSVWVFRDGPGASVTVNGPSASATPFAHVATADVQTQTNDSIGEPATITSAGTRQGELAPAVPSSSGRIAEATPSAVPVAIAAVAILGVVWVVLK